VRFTYRKIETLADKVSRSQKSSDSDQFSRVYKPTNSRSPLVVHGILMLSIGFLCAELYRGIEKKPTTRFEKVRVTVHEEPIEKHVWLDEKLMEIKTIQW